MNKTNIGWTDFSSNPIYAVDKATGKRGWFCERVSPGCAHCYASTLNGRWGNGLDYLPENADRIEFRLDERELDRITRRKKPARIFLCDMLDLFHEGIPDGFISDVWRAMAAAPQHTFQILTKRPERMREVVHQITDWCGEGGCSIQPWPLPNAWLGVSAENQRWADERIPVLLDTPAAVRFVSCEPLLSAIDIRPQLEDSMSCERHGRVPRSRWMTTKQCGVCLDEGIVPNNVPSLRRDLRPGLDWAIIGGESGHGHRPMDVAWAQSIVDQCDAAGVPVFCKQDAGPYPGKQGRLSDALWQRKEFPR